MGLFDRLERTLERAVNGAFAKAFKSSVQPVEIASAMRRAMDDRAAATSRISGKTASRATVPNMFTVELSTKDYDDLTAYADDLTDELLASAEEHIDSQRYRVAGPMRIIFAENTDLDTGVFTLRPASARRPFEITPEGVADRAVPEHHQYEEYEELSVGMPIVEDGARKPAHRSPVPAPEPAPTSDDAHRAHDSADDGAPRAWGTDAAAGAAAAASVGAAAAGAAGATSAAAGAAGAASATPAAPPREVAPPAHAEPAPAVPAQPVPQRPASTPAAPPARDPEPARGPRPAREPQQAAAPQRPAAGAQPAPARRPAPVRRPWLDIDGDRYPLLGAITVIGRDHTADIVLDDPGISRRHAEVRVTMDGPHPVITLTDLDSTNGVFVNGDRIVSEHVTDGDRITLGRSSMVLRTGGR